MIPTLTKKNFTFFSGDKDVVNSKSFPTNIIIDLAQGDSFSGSFVVKNHQDDYKEFSLDVDKFKLINANKSINTDSTLINEFPTLRFLHDMKFELGPEEVEIINYNIFVPKKVKDGEYMTVPSIELIDSSTSKNKVNKFIQLNPAIGISTKIKVSQNPIDNKYESLITKVPYSIATRIVILEFKNIITIVIGFLSFLFLYRYFKLKT